MNRNTTFGARCHFVADTDVGKGTAHHDFVVPAACAVGVEVTNFDAMRLEVFTCRAFCLDRTGRRNVVGGDRVTQEQERTSTMNFRELTRFFRHIDEVGRVLDVG